MTIIYSFYGGRAAVEQRSEFDGNIIAYGRGKFKHFGRTIGKFGKKTKKVYKCLDRCKEKAYSVNVSETVDCHREVGRLKAEAGKSEILRQKLKKALGQKPKKRTKEICRT
jgi:hypothetical protein